MLFHKLGGIRNALAQFLPLVDGQVDALYGGQRLAVLQKVVTNVNAPFPLVLTNLHPRHAAHFVGEHVGVTHRQRWGRRALVIIRFGLRR